MELLGQNLIAKTFSKEGNTYFEAINPANGKALPTLFYEATDGEVDKAVREAEKAFDVYRKQSGLQKANFLELIADEIMALGDTLIKRAMLETGLPEGRLTGERGRTLNQLRMFAQLVREGSWLGARIDHANPGRKPVPKPDTRQMQIPLGPVGIFGASNFPLAFSVAGGDTASALAAGCTIVVKAHPAHPGTCELVGRAIQKAIIKAELPDGVFSLIHGQSFEAGQALVRHPLIKAIGFTGSYRGGKAIFDTANQRPEPIPVYAEMGSTNPVFVLPEALKERKKTLAKGLAGSVTLGVGQFCTNPGLVITPETEDAKEFHNLSAAAIRTLDSGTMLTADIHSSYEQGLAKLSQEEEIEILAQGVSVGEGYQGVPSLFKTDAQAFVQNEMLEKELFGPSTLIVSAIQKSDIIDIARQLEGHLTATVHGTDVDLREYADLIHILERKVGRLIINGFPTGVEVNHAMVHGGPFPATTDSRSTSVGSSAITRFSRPVCYQDFPEFLLPDELKDNNPLGIWRLVDGEWGK